MVRIKLLLPTDNYQAIIGAISPSFTNYFATINQLGGATSLLNKRVAFGSLTNTITDSADITWDNTLKQLVLNGYIGIRNVAAPLAPVLGDIWYNGTDFIARATTRNDKIARVLTGSAILNFGNTLAQTSSDLTIPVTGCNLGDVVFVGVPNPSIPVNCSYTAFVGTPNNVTVRFNNYSALAINPNNGTFNVIVFKN